MKKLTISLLLLLILTACQKERPELKTDTQITQKFEQSDTKISEYLDALDNPKTPKEQSTKIICEDYPKTYKTEYMPALLELSPTYTEQGLMKDIDNALNFYKQKLGIECV